MSQDCYQMLGHRVLVRSTSQKYADQVRQLLRSWPVESTGRVSPSTTNGDHPEVTFSLLVAGPSKSPTIRPLHFVYRNYTQVGRSTSYWHLFRHLEVQLNLFLADHVTDRYFLHAGAVARDGVGIILPGESGSGKSSLTLALLRQGYRYLSDELAALDPLTGDLCSCPKPLSIKNIAVFPELEKIWFGPEPGEKSREELVWYAHPEDVESEVEDRTVPTRFIIFPSYDPTAEPQIQRVAPDEAMRGLVRNSVNSDRFGRDGFRLLARLAQESQCFSLTSPNLEAGTALINDVTQGHL